MTMKLPLTDRILRMIGRADRVALGLKTQDELAAAAEIKTERDLHKQIANLLRLRGIEFFESRMDRKTTRPKGEPDFLFCIAHKPSPDETTGSLLTWPVAMGWELKLPGKKLDPEQQAMFARMSTGPNGWQCCVISSVDQALDELRKLNLP
jgi:hypothetical protein